MNNTVTVSILSAVYNEEAYVDEMVASVLGQSHQQVELLIVDDGSTDRTREIVERWQASDARVKLVGDASKTGKVEAFNQAFRASSGGYVTLLGGDDTLPVDSIRDRLSSLTSEATAAERSVAFYRLRSFSEDPKFDGLVVPRKPVGNRSGGTMMLSRGLTDVVFPVDPSLVSEDLWIGHLAEVLADHVTDSPAIVLNYRIHDGNTTPRHLPFAAMSESFHARQNVWNRILECSRLNLSSVQMDRIRDLAELEHRRYAGQGLRVLTFGHVSLLERLRAFSRTSPTFYALRSRFYKLFSGWS